MTFRPNLIQKFALLNLFWLMAMGGYFGYWFSGELIKSITILHTTNLADDLHLDIDQRFSIAFFDEDPELPQGLDERSRYIETAAAAFLRNEVYPVQILWTREQSIWSNRKDRVGLTATMDSLVEGAFAGQDRAELFTQKSRLVWMYDSILNPSKVINDASSYLRLLLPISFPKQSLIQSIPLIKSPQLKGLIESTPNDSQVIPGVLELRKSARPILERTVKAVQSVWKRVIIVSLLTYIALFSLFKSAFNTIERQSKELREQERLSHLGKMASYLAHEIRNPLFIIRGSAQTIEEMNDESSPSRKLSRYIIEEVDRLNNMVQDLLGLVRPRLAPSRTPTSLSQALQESVDRSLKQAPKMTLVPQLDPECDLIWFNKDQLVQVFTNLFRNARDACRGQGTILVESRQAGDGNLQIRITDDGPGIPDKDLPLIFEPFFSKKENGTGLGLSIVRHLVTNNNATIEAVKPPGTGACFIMMVRQAPPGALENDDSNQHSPDTDSNGGQGT